MKTREELISHIDKGEVFEYIFFWDEPKRDIVDISCLNQWYKATFFSAEDKEEFLTAEHYMMYKKAIFFKDDNIAKKILETKSPREVQLLGREVKNYDDKLWQNISFDVVVSGNLKKFENDKEIKEYLLSTCDKILVEASPIDTIWGIGLGKNDKKAINPKIWLGKNKLGFALMEVRKRLKEK